MGECTFEGTVTLNCSEGIVGPGVFTYHYSDNALVDGLSSFQGSVDAGTLVADFTVGPLRDAETQYVEGTATVTQGGGGATVVGDGSTPNGTPFDFEVACSAVS